MVHTLQKSVVVNIKQDSRYNFLRKKHLSKSYEALGIPFENFITEMINQGKLSVKELNEYLFDELFFGQQRDTYIYKIYSFREEILNTEKLLEIMNKVFLVNEEKMLRITEVYSTSEEREKKQLVGFEVIKSETENSKVKKIKLLFCRRVEVVLKNSTRTENSYIPIEVDLENKVLIIKVSPKAKVITEKAKPEELVSEYYKKIERLFNIEIEKFNHVHKETMYKMCQELYGQVYSKMVSSKPEGIDKAVNDISKKLNNVLNIENIDSKKKINNIFNINENIYKLVEHLLITDILISATDNEFIDGIDGFVTYLRFNDGNNVSARLKGENCTDSIFDSETFMALRAPIENAKKLSILKVIWFKENKKLRISYDTTNASCLNIHFYKNLSEGDFYYGLDKYYEYERKSFDEIKRVDSLYAIKVAE